MLALVLLTASTLVSCGEPGDLGAAREAPDGDWELVVGTVDDQPISIVGGSRITLSISGDEIGGTAACNQYFGRWSRSGNRVQIGELGATEMACEPPVMQAESAYLQALPRVDRVRRVGDVLTLDGDGVHLEFRALAPPPTAELVDTEWVLESLVMGDTATSVSNEPGIIFHADGSLTGSTGCRRLVGRWVESGDMIDVPELSAQGECNDELWAQDNHVVTVIGDGFRFTIEGDRLTLTDPDGSGLVYRAAEAG